MKRICLGKIVSAHGVKGLVKVLPFGDEDPRLIETLGPMYDGEKSDQIISVTMKNSAGHKYWLAAIEGVSERNGAEALRGTELWTERDKLPEAEEGQFYYADLIGLKALDEKGQEIGEVVDVKNFGAGDLLEIQPKGKDSFYLPFAKETILEVSENLIKVKVPEGLL